MQDNPTPDKEINWNILELHEYEIVRNETTAAIMYVSLQCPFCKNWLQVNLDPALSPVYFTINDEGKISPTILCPYHGFLTVDIAIQLNNWGKYNA